MKKLLSLLLVLAVSISLVAPIAEAGAKGFSSGAKSSTSSSSTSKGFKSSSSTPSSSTTSGYKSSAPSGSSTALPNGATVTSGGGTTSGYKAPATPIAPIIPAPAPAPSQSASTNNYYGNRSSGMNGLLGGLAIGSLLAMPHSGGGYNNGGYNNGGGYVQGAPSGFNFLGWIFWAISWIFVLSLLGAVAYYGYRMWKGKA